MPKRVECKRGLLLILSGAASLHAAEAAAQTVVESVSFGTGNELLAVCMSNSISDQRGCMGFITGYIQGVVAGSLEAKAKLPFCIPEKVTVGQARDILVKALQDRPQVRHVRSDVLMMIAFRKTFPCPAPNSN